MMIGRNFQNSARWSASILKALVGIGVLCGATLSVSSAEDLIDAPAFFQMYGEWESYGVKAEPEAVFDVMPELAELHKITGNPSTVAPGVHFLVEQVIAGVPVLTELNYIYDSTTRKSFGVIASSTGARLRGVIDHGPHQDTLRIYDANDTIVWTETKKWLSDDEFESEGVFEFNGAPARVWFVTRRKVAQ